MTERETYTVILTCDNCGADTPVAVPRFEALKHHFQVQPGVRGPWVDKSTQPRCEFCGLQRLDWQHPTPLRIIGT